MIRLTCPSCQVRLNAKDELAGQTRKCPKCGATLQIPEAASAPSGPEVSSAAAGAETPADESGDWAGLDDVAPGQHVQLPPDQGLPKVETPKRLNHMSRYLICDKSRLIAMWEDNGQGWMLKTNAGFAKVGRTPEQLPAQGSFMLVELVMDRTDDGLRLQGLRCYELAHRWALTALEQDDHKILSRVTGPGHLTREQKSVVQQFLREQFMRNVWEDAHDVIEFLGNLDYHSPGVG